MNVSFFPPTERPLRSRLQALMSDWKREAAQSKVVFREVYDAHTGDLVIRTRS